MNILILGLGFKKQDTTYEMERLEAGLQARGHTVFCSLWSDVLFSFGKETTITTQGKDIAFFDYVICRYPLSTTTERPSREIIVSSFLVRMYKHFVMLVDYAQHHNTKVLNQDVCGTLSSYDKMTQHYILQKHSIPTLPSFLYTGYNQTHYPLKKPFVAKTIEGSRGVEVFLVHTDKELKEIVEQYGAGNVLVQQFVPNRKDYRLITIGDTVIGGVLCVNENDFRTNAFMGGDREKIEPSRAMKQLALTAKNALNAECTGIDIIQSNNQYYVLEVNIFPMFMGFENATGIDFVDALAQHIET
ncbi:MAG: ATP-grasp domain-containing protein [Candidatus Spechtbacteria bacterium SB0662_bin_43]|uniref:ATP-grasp domain-containing protein n=1 Tax=Candidatus Spechtbacteria bacterium SB0662_bin_43 TaxID=2604897 RepID=A0A845DEI6_9BACT|nr:ATP-grasp domain-containing protein [Candidatus Spechtbacteria bacterium SB0662_bin_43]